MLQERHLQLNLHGNYNLNNKIMIFKYGLQMTQAGSLKPQTLPEGAPIAPDSVLSITRCKCISVLQERLYE